MWGGYKTARWRRLRERILRRDGYLCQESLRYGLRVQADTVHHVWPAEDWPEYAWCEWNLISLCGEKHNAMHDRTTGKLAPLGERWMRRVSPPFIPGTALTIEDRGRGVFPTERGNSGGGGVRHNEGKAGGIGRHNKGARARAIMFPMGAAR